MSSTVRQRDDRWEYRYDAGRDPNTGRRLRPGRSGFDTREARTESPPGSTSSATTQTSAESGCRNFAWPTPMHDLAAEASGDADREAAEAVAALILRGSNGRESGRDLVHNDDPRNEEPADPERFRRSAGSSTCSGGRI